MSLDPSFRHLRDALDPENGAKARVFARLEGSLRSAEALKMAAEQATPTKTQQSVVWARISARLEGRAVSLLERLRELINVNEPAQAFVVLRNRLDQHATQSAGFGYAMRWAAAAAVFVILVRISPFLFLAPHSSASSDALLLPTRGTVEVSLQGLWQPIADPLTLKDALSIRTADGEATVMLHDDGNVRLDTNTSLIVREFADRPEQPAVSGPSLSVLSGRVWVQGMIPQQVRGIDIATPQGDITIQEGSVSLTVEEDGDVIVDVWDRHAVVLHEGQELTLIAGERARLTDSTAIIVSESDSRAQKQSWVSQNLDRDAVHRREVSQMQLERRIADAGILPTSPFYSVKRIAEQMDLLMTIDSETKVRKQLDFASTRLDEAAALIAQGSESGSTLPLEEYRSALMAIATGTGADQLTQQLVANQLQENVADMTALTPTESGYILKKAVLEAGASLPGAVIGKTDVESVVLMDTLDALKVAVANGNIEQVNQTFGELRPYLKSIQEGKSQLSTDTRKEALSLLADFANTVQERDTTIGDIGDSLLKETAQYLPQEEVLEAVPLTDEQIAMLVKRMLTRIENYTQPRSQWNQLHTEFRSIEKNPDRERILHALYYILSPDLAPYVRTELRKLHDQQ